MPASLSDVPSLCAFFRDFRRVVIADMRVQCCHQHQRFIHQFADTLLVGFDVHHAIVGETHACIGDEADGLQHVINNHRLEHIKFEMAVGTGDGHRHVVAHYLSAHHRHRFRIVWD